MTIAWGELDRLVGPPKPERRPAGARFLILPASATRRPGTTPSWSPGRCSTAAVWKVRGQGRKRRRPVLIVERTENPQWLSNAYLVADEEGGKGVLIDGNDDLGPLLERAERDGIEITHILVTHPHVDHVAGLAEAREKLGGAAARRPRRDRGGARGRRSPRRSPTARSCSTGGLEIEAISTPGHAAGHLAFLVDGSDVFTADVLFKGTVGGTMAPGASGFDDLQVLGDAADGAAAGDGRPPRPPRADDDRRGARRATPSCGSGAAATETGEEQVTVWGRPATLKLWAPDYDGGNKAWVVFGDTDEEAIVGGSQVERS